VLVPPSPNPVPPVVPVVLDPNPDVVLGLATVAGIVPGLAEVAPPKKDPPVPTPVLPSVVPVVELVANPPKVGGFFLDEPDRPNTAGWLGLIFVLGSRVGLFGGAVLLSPPNADDVPAR